MPFESKLRVEEKTKKFFSTVSPFTKFLSSCDNTRANLYESSNPAVNSSVNEVSKFCKYYLLLYKVEYVRNTAVYITYETRFFIKEQVIVRNCLLSYCDSVHKVRST